MSIFTPDKLRFYSWLLLRFALGMLFLGIPIMVLLAPKPNPASILFYAICVTVGGALGMLIGLERIVTRAQIVITDETISGPPAWFTHRVQFPLNNLDKEKSSEQNFFQHILGFRLIQSKIGEKIMLAERTFDKDQVAMLLDLLGCRRLETK